MQFFAQQLRVPASTPYWRDPKVLPRWGAGVLKIGTDDDTTVAFWNAISNIGDYQSSDPSTGTRTILNVSGRGQLRGLIGPTHDNVAPTTITWTVTLDGTAYVITQTAQNIRFVIGLRGMVSDVYTTAGAPANLDASTNLLARDATWLARIQDTRFLLPPTDQLNFVKFDSSMTVTISSSRALSNNRCGVVWNLDT